MRSRRAPAEHAARWHARHLERVGHLDRRRGGVVGRWVRAAAAGPGRPLARLKPCLSVCQLVEQHCPYFLPADRAPAYPTQYAGEPTFLCLGEFLFLISCSIHATQDQHNRFFFFICFSFFLYILAAVAHSGPASLHRSWRSVLFST